MSRTNKGGKPIGWEYWGKRKGGSFVDRETSHKIERMQLKEELHNLPNYHEPNKIGYDGTHEHPDIVRALSSKGVVKVWVDSNCDYISIDGKYLMEVDDFYNDYYY